MMVHSIHGASGAGITNPVVYKSTRMPLREPSSVRRLAIVALGRLPTGKCFNSGYREKLIVNETEPAFSLSSSPRLAAAAW
jgi:hypothetical protein